MRTALILLVTAIPVSAEAPLSGDAFDLLTRGKTYFYSDEGMPYGAEEYRDNREVVWSFLDGRCIYGSWYQDGDAICFVYDGLDGPQCWRFYDDGRLSAEFLGGDTDLVELGQRRSPLECRGPDVGV